MEKEKLILSSLRVLCPHPAVTSGDASAVCAVCTLCINLFFDEKIDYGAMHSITAFYANTFYILSSTAVRIAPASFIIDVTLSFSRPDVVTTLIPIAPSPIAGS